MKNKFGKIAYVLVISICLIVLVSSLTYLISYEYDIRQDIKVNEKLQLKKQQNEVDEELQLEKQQNEVHEESKLLKETETIQEQQILKVYRSFYEENSDIYGWITIADTEIDYPVMYTPEDPNFYEDKNWNKEVCRVGTSVWIDGRTTNSSNNIIIYGHSMRYHRMFAALDYYKDKKYYEEHRYIQFDTLYERQTYEIISVSKAVVYYEDETPTEGEYLFYEHIELDSAEEFQAYIDNAKKNAYYPIETTAEYGDKLITLTTCDYWGKNARLLIIAKRIS